MFSISMFDSFSDDQMSEAEPIDQVEDMERHQAFTDALDNKERTTMNNNTTAINIIGQDEDGFYTDSGYVSDEVAENLGFQKEQPTEVGDEN